MHHALPDPQTKTQPRRWFWSPRDTRRRWLAGGGTFLLLILFLVLQPFGPSRAFAQTFTNSSGITIPASGTSGAASSYPATITVPPNTLNGTINKVTVKLLGLTHSFPGDLDVLLVGPQGQKVLLMSDVGGGNAVNNITLTFDDAGGSLPLSSAIASGTYKPTNSDTSTDAFPAPAPAGPYAATLATFNNTSADGVWSLYINDDSNTGTGSLVGGWELNIASADLSVSVSAPPSVSAGTDLAYSVTATNNGPDQATNAALSIPLPASTTFQALVAPGGWSCTPPAVGAAGSISCTNALFSGAATFNVTGRVAPDVGDGTTLRPSATISSATPDTNAANNTAGATSSVNSVADTGLSASADPNPVQAGALLVYTFNVVNNGPSHASNLRLVDSIPANTVFESLTEPAGWSCTTPTVGDGGTVDCLNTSFGIGNASFSLTVRVNANTPAGTTLTNTPGISAANDSTPANNALGQPLTTSVGTTADLAVTETVTPDPVNAGADLSYQITVTNNGPSNAANTELTNTLPAHTILVSFDGSAGWNCVAPISGASGTITCTNSSFSPGISVFNLVVRVDPSTPAGTVIANTSSIAATTGDTLANNNSATATSTVTTVADLSITANDTSDPVNAGANLTYQIVATNAGPSTAVNATLSSALPPNTTMVSFDVPPGSGWNCNGPGAGNGGTISCSNAAFAVGSTTFTLVVRVAPTTAANTTLTSAPTIGASTGDPILGNNIANQATTTVSTQADVSVTQSDTPDPVNAGADLTYLIVVTNTGPSNAANVTLTDSIPANTSFQSIAVPEGWTCNTLTPGGAGTLSCSTPSLGVTSSIFTLAVRVDAGVANGTKITNIPAIASNGSNDPDSSNNSAAPATCETTVTTQADLGVAATALPNPVSANANLTYDITVVNNGPSTATNARLRIDALPDNTLFRSFTAPAGWNCPTLPAVNDIGAVECSIASLPVGSANFSLVVHVKSGTAVGTLLSLSPTVSSATPDSVTANNALPVLAQVTVAADLGVTLSANPNPVAAGAVMTYTIGVNNSGPEIAENVTVVLTPAPNTTFERFSAAEGWDCTFADGVFTCTNLFLDVTTDTILFAVKVQDGLPLRTALPTTVRVSSPTPEGEPGNPGNNEATLVARANVPPEIILQPGHQLITGSHSATLSVEATGTGPLVCQWYEGTSGDTSKPISDATEASFTTPPLTSATRYWVRITNPLGSVDSTTAVVTVDSYKLLVTLVRK